MRVIAGTARGFPLRALRVAGLRPTSDLVRGAIFDMVGPYFSAELRVADLYAGTGALGIEALSRGAGWVDFVEQQPRCCAALVQNLQRTGLWERAGLHCMPVRQALPRLGGRYGLALLDPPYAEPLDLQALAGLAEGGLMLAGGTVVLEHSRRTPVAGRYGRLCLLKQRQHGDTVISVFEMEGEQVG
ncbi:MAG: RsmD family RNA methyltransferase [Chloroflexi bacterium]|nr:RsmD family RNA methyltransferase [Chloroflexota bacterium]